MLRIIIALALALVFTSKDVHGFAENSNDHVDRSPADIYIRGIAESQILNRQKRQSNDKEFREMFVTQCGYFSTEPEGEPSINIKGVSLNNWAAVEKVREPNITRTRDYPKLPTHILVFFLPFGHTLASILLKSVSNQYWPITVKDRYK